jgi:carnitine-CoA ligase
VQPLEPHLRVLSTLLNRQAEAFGDRPLLRVGDQKRSYASMRDAAARLAGAFAARGIGRGDRVAVMADNRIELLDTFAACGWLGAIFVPINTALRGAQLEHLLRNAAPRTLAIETTLLSQLETVERLPEELEQVWLLGVDGPPTWRGLPAESFPTGSVPIDAAPTKPGDTLAILYTSGTTGPSKGVCCPQAQFYWWGVNTGSALGITDDDVLYSCLPLFHTNALNSFVQALLSGACFAVGPRFSASQFWARLVEAEATVTYLLGAMVAILWGREPGPLDRAHRVRIALAPATPADLHSGCLERFGISIVEAHGMTETNVVIGPRNGEQRPGSMGRVMPGFDAKVVDEEDVEVLDGTPGELVMRATEPFAFATGYWRMPEETVAARRNLWFHSGDRVVRDDAGYFRFLDRTKDAIRRRGENISAWEVEQVIQSHPGVAAAAAIPVPSELSEDDVMAFVVPNPGARLEPAELIAHCEPRLAYFAIPRYLEIVPELPLTENGKVQKYVLRAQGVTESTWDRDEAGYVLRR